MGKFTAAPHDDPRPENHCRESTGGVQFQQDPLRCNLPRGDKPGHGLRIFQGAFAFVDRFVEPEIEASRSCWHRSAAGHRSAGRLQPRIVCPAHNPAPSTQRLPCAPRDTSKTNFRAVNSPGDRIFVGDLPLYVTNPGFGFFPDACAAA